MWETLVQFLGWEDPLEKGYLPTPAFLGSPCGSAGKESTCNTGDLGLISGLGRSPGEGKDYPLQYSGLENSMDKCLGLQRIRHDRVTFTFIFTWGSQGKNTEVIYHSLLQWTTFSQNSPSWPICLAWSYMAIVHSFIELDKAVFHVVSLIGFLWLWFSFCLCCDG